MSTPTWSSVIKVDEVSGPRSLRIEELDAIHDPVERARANAIREGYEEGRRRAIDEVDEQRALMRAKEQYSLSSAAAALEEATETVVALLRDRSDELESKIASLVFEISTAVIRRELELSANPGEDALARALELVPPDEPTSISLHPEDLATIEQSAVRPKVRLIADPSIERGGSVIQIGATRIDARIDTALERVRLLLESTTRSPR